MTGLPGGAADLPSLAPRAGLLQPSLAAEAALALACIAVAAILFALLRRAKARLAAEMRARAAAERDLQRALAGQCAAEQELETFAYVTSHDLQAPLRSISGFSQLLVRRHRERLDGEALEFLQYIEQGTHQMQALIQDLLALSRVGRAEPIFEEQPLAATVERALAPLREAIERSGATIEYAGLPAITADHALLAQLLQNLVGNALKFRRPEVRPAIRIEARQDGEDWLLSIADNGIGIAQEQLQNIFIVFRRLHGAGEYEGGGMGLAICRKIAALHGGAIWATSGAEGSQFHLRLPRHPVKKPSIKIEKSVPDLG